MIDPPSNRALPLNTGQTTRPKVVQPIADWATLRLFNQYRLLMVMALAAVFYIADDQRTLGERDQLLFEVAHLGYLVLSLLFIYLQQIRTPSAETQVYVQGYVDIVCISILIYASGGVASGLAPVLILNLALLSQVTSKRHALLFAAITSLVVLGEELLANILIGSHAANFESTAMLGMLLFAVAWLITVPLRHLVSQQLTEPTAMRAGLDLKEIAELNEEIVRELDSGVVVIDGMNHVQLINDTARALLSTEFLPLPMPLSRLCEPLLVNMKDACQSPTLATRPFDIPSTGQAILPRYIHLSNGGMLIKLDDHAEIRHQYQQLKLASLGRLSASIAHEIRNPLGAISHAVQLIEESPTLNDSDSRLLDIARKNTLRINRIVEDVLQLSNRQSVSRDTLDLNDLTSGFCQRFRDENALSDEQLILNIEPAVQAVFDPEHLDQVLWNLCTNAMLHNDGQNIAIMIECWQSDRGVVTIDIVDDGAGITDIDREKLFEPFFSTHQAGTGLGLFIIRELCELNKASIECLENEQGAHFRIQLASVMDMAA